LADLKKDSSAQYPNAQGQKDHPMQPLLVAASGKIALVQSGSHGGTEGTTRKIPP
jgi:hypothetical protein